MAILSNRQLLLSLKYTFLSGFDKMIPSLCIISPANLPETESKEVGFFFRVRWGKMEKIQFIRLRSVIFSNGILDKEASFHAAFYICHCDKDISSSENSWKDTCTFAEYDSMYVFFFFFFSLFLTNCSAFLFYWLWVCCVRSYKAKKKSAAVSAK